MSAAAAHLPVASDRAWLHHLRIRDFRNLAAVDITPPPEGLALVGDNGQGKTNFLEAIYYLQLLRSFRGARDQDLVRFGAPAFHLSSGVHGGREREISVGFERAGPRQRPPQRKRVKLGGVEAERLTDALGTFPAVIFSPHDGVLVSGAPSVRRRYIDVVLALTSRPYLAALQRYRTALGHRNAALRAGGLVANDARVTIWEAPLARQGALLWTERRAWIESHAARFATLCTAIGERGTPALAHVTTLAADASVLDRDAALGAAESAMLEQFDRRRAGEVARGMTLVGPHRDDLMLTLDGRELRTYGSAGQQRTAAIALRLLEAATLRYHAGSEPVVLLDDPFAELDARRSGRILDLLNSEGRGQTMLAVPRATDIPPGLTRLERWRIEDGRLEPEAT